MHLVPQAAYLRFPTPQSSATGSLPRMFSFCRSRLQVSQQNSIDAIFHLQAVAHFAHVCLHYSLFILLLDANFEITNVKNGLLHFLQNRQGYGTYNSSKPFTPRPQKDRPIADFPYCTGEIPSFKLYDSPKVFAFLDINPLAKGHAVRLPLHQNVKHKS